MSKKATASTTEQFAKAAHRAIDDVAEKVQPIESQARERASETAENVSRRAEEARESGQRAFASLQSTMRERPLATAGIAFAAGILTSMFLRRK